MTEFLRPLRLTGVDSPFAGASVFSPPSLRTASVCCFDGETARPGEPGEVDEPQPIMDEEGPACGTDFPVSVRASQNV